jgi:hypothetical protein
MLHAYDVLQMLHTAHASDGDLAMTSPSHAADAELHCALTGRVLSPDEAYWAPPLVTFNQLVTTIAATALRAPAQLGHLLTAEQADVAYAPEARELLVRRRSVEQAKFLGALLVGLLIIAALAWALL